MHVDIQSDLLLIGFKNGSFQMRHRSDLKVWTAMSVHDMDYGRVRKVCINYDKTGVLTVGEDGTFYVHALDYRGFTQGIKGL